MAIVSLITRTHSWEVIPNNGSFFGRYTDHISGKAIQFMYNKADDHAKLFGKYEIEIPIGNSIAVNVLDMMISERVWLLTCVDESIKSKSLK
ncbi:MAG: hypothetical protein R6U89_02505 [Dehalococcoidia bacterium]